MPITEPITDPHPDAFQRVCLICIMLHNVTSPTSSTVEGNGASTERTKRNHHSTVCLTHTKRSKRVYRDNDGNVVIEQPIATQAAYQDQHGPRISSPPPTQFFLKGFTNSLTNGSSQWASIPTSPEQTTSTPSPAFNSHTTGSPTEHLPTFKMFFRMYGDGSSQQCAGGATTSQFKRRNAFQTPGPIPNVPQQTITTGTEPPSLDVHYQYTKTAEEATMSRKGRGQVTRQADSTSSESLARQQYRFGGVQLQ